MKTASAKAKGRKGQYTVRDDILKHNPELTEDDVKSTSMGANGIDIQLSTAAKKLFPYSVEVKARKSIAACRFYDQAKTNCASNTTAVVAMKEDRKPLMALMEFSHFLELSRKAALYDQRA